MTDEIHPDGTDEIDEIDRRGRAARAELRAAVAAAPVPEFGGVQPIGRRRSRALLAAAAILVVAVAGVAVLVAGGSDRESTVAGQPGLTHLVLPDPADLGYELVAAFEASDPSEPLAEPATVQGPAGAEDPWQTAVVEYSFPSYVTTLGGQPVDLGGPEAMVDDTRAPLVVGWIDGDVTRYLMSTHLDRDTLVELARSAVAAGWRGGEALPGRRVLHAGQVADVFPILSGGFSGVGTGYAGVAYTPVTDEGRRGAGGVVIAAAPGSAASWRATFALAEGVDHLTIRGNDAVLAETEHAGAVEVSWLEEDGTLVRMGAPAGTASLPELAERLVEITDGEFAELVRDRPRTEPGTAQTTTTIEGPFLASIATEDEVHGTAVRATLRDGEPGPTVEVTEQHRGGESATTFDLPGLATNAAWRQSTDGGLTVAVVGVIGPSVDRVELRRADTGAAVEATGPSTTPIEGSTYTFFVATVSATVADLDLVVVGLAADGTEVASVPV